MYVCMYICVYVGRYVCVYVSMYVHMYVCMYIYIYMYVCMYVCMCVCMYFFKHAPLLWSNTTCCNLHVSFIRRGCSEQHHGVSQCIPFTILKQHTNIVKAVQLQLEMCTYTRAVRKVSSLFLISREPVAWQWCNVAASQRRPYCASVNSHCPVGLVSRQWDAVDWACVLCDRRIHKSPPFQRLF